MKVIKYQIATEIDRGTPDDPDVETVLAPTSMIYTERNYQMALDDAYQGQVTVEDVLDTRPLHEIKSDKEAEISAACNAAITGGMDVETSQGTEHFALQETDQINLTTALSAVKGGITAYPYHADGQLCRMFTAEEILAIVAASIEHKLYHTTLCNHLLMWVRRTETVEELEGITYTAEGLPEDLAANMAQVLGTDGGGADA